MKTYNTYSLEKESSFLKQIIPVQLPYKVHIRMLNLGFVLDVGCGRGRNLLHLKGNGIGVDPDAEAVETARQRGLRAFTPKQFLESQYAKSGQFDSLLCAHVIEHTSKIEATKLIQEYIGYIKKDGKVVIITPQQAGFKSDPTHVEYFGEKEISALAQDCKVTRDAFYSFPFPSLFGNFFTHNENVFIGHKV